MSPEPLVATSAADVTAWLAEALLGVDPSRWLAVDTETTGWDPWADQLRTVQVAGRPELPVLVIDTTAVRVEVLADVLADEEVLKVFHNAAFDVQVLHRRGLHVRRVADTMLAQQLLDACTPTPVGAGLAAVAESRLGVALDKSVRTTFGTASLTRAQVDYAAQDARVTWDVFAQQNRELQAWALVDVARLEFGAVVPVADMQLRGLRLDVDAWHEVMRSTEDRLPGLQAAAQDAMVHDATPMTLLGPEPVNLDSPEQVLAALHARGITVTSTREAVLRDHIDHPAVRALLAYRQAAKLVSGWGGDWADRAVHPATGRVHSRVRQIVGTGRMAHSDPNLTQIPADPAYRRCFTAAPGNLLVVADYSQQELRVLAAVSGDPALADIFRRGADLHAQTAAMVFGTDVAAVTGEQRKAAKALNFGLMYGMGATGFARATDMTVDAARQVMDRYFATFATLDRWLHDIERTARRDHLVRTPLGRARYMQDAGTFARNAPIQGAGADMTKLAVVAVDAAVRRRWATAPDDAVGLVLTVHDELVVEVPGDDADEAADLVSAAMVDAARRVLGEVPAQVDVRVGPGWG